MRPLHLDHGAFDEHMVDLMIVISSLSYGCSSGGVGRLGFVLV
jgi:hypothetical protein